MVDDLIPDGFLFTLPLYSYLIEPGPKPGYLRDPKTQIIFVPLWTDGDTFATYLERSGLAGKVSALLIHSRAELLTFLRLIPNLIKHVMIDPIPKAPAITSVFELERLIKELSSGK
jgi:hypothetical protein